MRLVATVRGTPSLDFRFRLTALLSTGFQLTLPLDDSERDPLARRSA